MRQRITQRQSIPDGDALELFRKTALDPKEVDEIVSSAAEESIRRTCVAANLVINQSSPPTHVETEAPVDRGPLGSAPVSPMRAEADPSFVRCTPDERPLVCIIQRYGGLAHQRNHGNLS